MRSAYLFTLTVSFFALHATQTAAADGYYFRNVQGASAGREASQPLSLSTNSVPSTLSAGDPAAGAFKASGGTPPYSFAKSGLYPTGLDLGTDGALVGSFPQPGTYTLGAVVRDSASQSMIQSMTVQVRPAPPTVALSTPATAVAGLAYAASAISGDPGSPLTWSLAGASPTWLTVDAQTGYIFGTTPTTGSGFTLAVSGADAYGRSASGTAAVSIVQPYVSSNLALPIYPGDRVSFGLQTNLTSPEFGATGVPAWLVRQGLSFAGTAPANTGNYGFQATAKQGTVNTTVTIPVAVSPVDVVLSGLPATVNTQTQFSGAIAATSGTGWSYNITGKPAEMTVDPTTGALSGTVANRAETLNITPTASRNGVTVSGATRALSIIQPAKITMAASYGYRTNAASTTIQPVYTGSTPVATWSLGSNKPAGMSISPSTGLISVTPGANPIPATTITVLATDTKGAVTSNDFSYKVAEALSVSYGTVVFGIGANNNFLPAVSNAIGTLSFTTRNNNQDYPYGLTLDPLTGAISGVTDYAADGAVAFVDVTDNGEASPTQVRFRVPYTSVPVVDSLSGGTPYGALTAAAAIQQRDTSGLSLSAGQSLTLDFKYTAKRIKQVLTPITGGGDVTIKTEYKDLSGNWQAYQTNTLTVTSYGNYAFYMPSTPTTSMNGFRMTVVSGAKINIDAIIPVTDSWWSK